MNDFASLRVALVHDWLTGMRGGEKCLEAMLDIFPRADIFTLLHLPGKVSSRIESRPIRTSFIQRLPLASRYYRHYLPLFPRAIEAFDLVGYDLAVSLSHCVAKAVRTPPRTPHICYCFTPMRYAWDQYQAYFGHLRGPRAALIRRRMERLRRWDAATADRVTAFFTISRFVADRIAGYYRRQAEVIYPPVETAFFTPGSAAGDYYLTVSALSPYKRLDILVQAAPELSYPVVIVGTGPEERRLRGLSRGNVTFRGWLEAQDLLAAYRGCRAFIFTAEEDLGLTPIEAMACGKPVIAYGRGGAVETVIALGEKGDTRPPTGIFFDRQESAALIAAAAAFEKNIAAFTADSIRSHALSFTAQSFRERFAAALKPWAG